MVGQHPEGFTETVQHFIEQRRDGLRRTVPAGDAGAARGDYYIDRIIGNPVGNRRPDPVNIIGHDDLVKNLVACIGYPLNQGFTGYVIALGAAVGNHQDGDV